VTVRVTTLKGVDAGAYYVEQLPNYYLDSGEPRGIWFGAGAHTLGLSGEVDDDAFLAVMAGMRPDNPDKYLGGRYNEKSARGYDVTASAPKSVSILFALGNPTVRSKVVTAHDHAVGAIVGWIEDHAHTRYRISGTPAMVDAEGIIAAQFRQHTSRALDPQLHTHVVIPNRVQSPDGRWLALDARLIKLDQRTLSGLYHATLRAELTASLGVRWEQPERGIAEIADVPEGLRGEFSTRTAGVLARVEEKLDRFVETMGREPTPRERWRLEREAAVDSRPAKPKGVDAAKLHGTWADQTRAFGLEPAQVVAGAVGHVRRLNGITEHETAAIITGALVNISEKQSSWRPTELTRELAALIPTDLTWPAARLVAWLDQLTEQVVQELCVDISRPVGPNDLLRKDGRPVTESVADRALTVQSILDQEAGLIEWVDRRLRHDGFDNPDAPGQSALSLNPAQASAAAAVAGTDDVVFVVGPAGTGKTTALAPAVEQLRADGRAVFGVAPSATAAEVLGAETGAVADTLDKLLIEHQLARPPDHRYDLPAGATVIVDEAGMIPTQKLAELAALADVKGWRVALVGDPFQFSAVGRGGMFGLFVDTFGAVELEHVHRFVNAWERDASLRLRRGDVTVAEEYEAHGRLHGGSVAQMEREVVAAWWAHRRAGESVLLMTPTNEVVERLNLRCQQTRINTGDLNAAGRRLTVGPYTMHVGDEIATRRNDRRLLTDRHEMVKNRAMWTVEQIGADGSLTVAGTAGTVRLPSSYVSEHVELAYARTGMGAQGRTVRIGLTFYERASDVRNVYVPMSRGTQSNQAFIGTTGDQTALDVLTQSIATDWIDQPAHTRRAELNGTELHRPGLLDGNELRELLEQRHEITSSIAHAESELARFPKELYAAKQAKAQAEKHLMTWEAGIEAATLVLERFDRPLHRRKHEPEIAAAKQQLRELPEHIRMSSSHLHDANQNIDMLEQQKVAASDVLGNRSVADKTVRQIDEWLSDDIGVRMRIARLEQPDTVTHILGDRPPIGPAARAWDLAAGHITQHQAAFGIDDGLGQRPAYRDKTVYAESYAIVADLIPKPAQTLTRTTIERPSFGISL